MKVVYKDVTERVMFIETDGFEINKWDLKSYYYSYWHTNKLISLIPIPRNYTNKDILKDNKLKALSNKLEDCGVIIRYITDLFIEESVTGACSKNMLCLHGDNLYQDFIHDIYSTNNKGE